MKYSVLDLACLREGQTYKEAYDDQLRLAKAVEGFGFERFWIAEHHNTKRLGSSATQLLIQRVLSNTSSIRVGAGGVMLPNHSPYLVAEQYGTLETLYPGRLDLGLGRAPGTNLKTAQAIRQSEIISPHFERDLTELVGYFEDTAEVHAYPAAGLSVPIYVLGSSGTSAHLAAEWGLPYSFAAHFAPTDMEKAISIYHAEFKPSKWLAEPYVILGLNAIVADTDEEARSLSTTHLMAVLGILNESESGLVPPMESEEAVWDAYVAAEDVPHFGPVEFDRAEFLGQEKELVAHMMACSLIGSPSSFAQQLEELQQRVEIDEIMINSFIYDQEAQIHSFELIAETLS